MVRPPPAAPLRSWRSLRALALLLFTLSCVGCDHATKHAAVTYLSGRAPLQIVPGVLDLRLAHNHDTAFSLTHAWVSADKPLVLAVAASVVLLGALVAWWSQRRSGALVHLGYALVVAGALGNLIDRFTRGFVVDFVHLARWPVFNVADVAVVLGVGLLLVGGARGNDRPPDANSSRELSREVT